MRLGQVVHNYRTLRTMPIQMNNVPDQIRTWLNTASPEGTAAASGPTGPAVAFDSREAEAIAGAVMSRRHEFLTGRALARAALGQLGCNAEVIPIGDQRMPVWPDRFVGSISHSAGLCAVQVGHRDKVRAIGIDIERDGAVTGEIYHRICGPGERDRLSSHAPCDVATLAFSAKEAFFKAYYPEARTFLDFNDVTLDIDWPGERFIVTLLSSATPAVAGHRALHGRFAWIGTFVVTGVWLPA
jgi:4'-phosphopantetheinyl transferase EntD